MALIVQNTDLIGAGLQITVGTGDDLLVTEGTTVASTNDIAITSTGTNHVFFINGTVASITAAVNLEGDWNQLIIGTTGSISASFNVGSNQGATFVRGDNAQLVNHGTVSGGSALVVLSGSNGKIQNTGNATGTNALAFDNMDAGSVNTAVNSGYAFGTNYGFIAFGDSSGISTYNITNTGTLGGLVGSILGTSSVENVVNSGTLIGDVFLLGGADVFDGLGGTFDGTVLGGDGDDTFIIDDATINLFEDAAEGTDTVQSTVGWTLGDNFENLTLIGSSNVDGYGNVESNTITGNQGNNVLNGLGSADTLYGKAGDDKLNGGNGIDLLFGGDGDDRLRGQKGADILKADAGNDSISGGEGNDNLFGGDDNDILKGGMGKDKLYGGDDADVFLFTKAAQSKNDSTA
ncbi:MAG: calcium-binding protein, partial [Rhodobacteraceae bacterium]|nr:calcium-binding protein [Paracoccaceae bacterium]